MSKENKNLEVTQEEMPKTRAFVRNALQTVKLAVVAAVILTSVVGGYVLANGELRNKTIDFAQGQTDVQAESPKGN